ncbi:MAG: DUF1592 domain-containing protein [Rhodobacteraceae bacterium]|nr:DUF1592 domain-containing protein [Paracoccaceae bacterium]
MRKSIFHMIAAVAAAISLSACDGPREPEATGGPPAMRRLSNDQYRNIIADVFGPQITVAGQADSLKRSEGMLAVGAQTAEITPSGFEKFYGMAKSIAAQVVSESNRAVTFPCEPKDAVGADDACARTFFAGAGRLLYRRPLAQDELTLAVETARRAAESSGDFYRGVAVSLANMLVAPQFLFITDEVEPDPAAAGLVRLTGFAKAARLSFFLWNTTPDDALLRAAESGDLHTQKGVSAQVERMMASHRLEAGVRAFFEDFLHFEQFETLEKDTIIYPAFTVKVVEDSKEQLLRTVVSLLLDRKQDYREIFTTRDTFVTGSLARVYRVPTSRPSGEAWVPYRFPDNDPRAGIITQIGFAAVASHPGRSSPTLRGRAIRENLLCQKVPDPPGDVDFSLFESADALKKTARERLTIHRTAPACAGCHKITDPIGLGLENLDGLGQLRTTENEAVIDPSGDLDGVEFSNAADLGKALHDNPAATSCVVGRLASYALGRSSNEERNYVQYLEESFASDGYRFPDLMRRIATGDALFAVTPAPTQLVSAQSSTPEMERSP